MDFENRNEHLIDVRHVTAVILNATAVRQALTIDPPNLAIAITAARCLIRDSRDIVEIVTRLTALFRGKSMLLTVRSEIEEFSPRLRSPECREALTAFFEKRPPDFNRTKKPATVA